MTDGLGAEYRYLCTTCLEVLGPRDVAQHSGECAAVATLSRLDMWLHENVEECPECGLETPAIELPEDVTTVPEWHEAGAEEVRLEPCGHIAETRELIHEYGGE